jgi:hypothetical protein
LPWHLPQLLEVSSFILAIFSEYIFKICEMLGEGQSINVTNKEKPTLSSVFMTFRQILREASIDRNSS